MCSDTGFESSMSCVQGGTIRWMSPELFDPERFGLKDSRPTMESDRYALGMVIYEVLSGQKPFAQCRDPTVIRKVIDGERPERPRGAVGAWFADDVWGTVELCWGSRPESRPDVKTVLQCLERVSERFQPTSRTEEYCGAGATSIDDQSCYFTAVDISCTFHLSPKHAGSSRNSSKDLTEWFQIPNSLTNRQPRGGQVLTSCGGLVGWCWREDCGARSDVRFTHASLKGDR